MSNSSNSKPSNSSSGSVAATVRSGAYTTLKGVIPCCDTADGGEGAFACVTGTERSVSPVSLSTKPIRGDYFGNLSLPSPSTSTPPPTYISIYPDTPPSSAPSSPSNGATTSINDAANPLITALAAVDLGDAAPAPTPALEDSLLDYVFPEDSAVHGLPSRAVELAQIQAGWEGVVLDNPDQGTRTLYVAGGSYEDVNMRESVCAVLELAEEDLACTGVVMCLEKKTPHIGDLIHALLYVGGTITNLPFPAAQDYILVGLDL